MVVVDGASSSSVIVLRVLPYLDLKNLQNLLNVANGWCLFVVAIKYLSGITAYMSM